MRRSLLVVAVLLSTVPFAHAQQPSGEDESATMASSFTVRASPPFGSINNYLLGIVGLGVDYHHGKLNASIDATGVLAGINADMATSLVARAGYIVGGERRGKYAGVPLLLGVGYYHGDTPEEFELRFSTVTQVSAILDAGLELGYVGDDFGFMFRFLLGYSVPVHTSVEDESFNDAVNGAGMDIQLSAGLEIPL